MLLSTFIRVISVNNCSLVSTYFYFIGKSHLTFQFHQCSLYDGVTELNMEKVVEEANTEILTPVYT